MRLIAMAPRSDLSSTSYALADPGKEYLLLQPAEALSPFTVTLESGTYTIEWFSVSSRQMETDGEMFVERSGTITFTPKPTMTGRPDRASACRRNLWVGLSGGGSFGDVQPFLKGGCLSAPSQRASNRPASSSIH
jgi:hypothetical protein